MNSSGKVEGAAPWSESAPSVCNPKISFPQKYINNEADQFLKMFAEGESVTFQTFDDRTTDKRKYLAKVFHGTLDDHGPELAELNKKGVGIFFTVNATDSKGRESKNITKVRAAFVDLDGVPLEPVLQAPLEPHFIVETSPGRYHVYWLIEGLPLSSFQAVQKALIQKYDGDPVICDLPRVMRVPGFNHCKSKSFLVRVINRSEGLPYSSEKFLKAFNINIQTSKCYQNPLFGFAHDPILQELQKREMVKKQSSNKPGAWEITCPFRELHTTGDDGTVYFEAYTNGYQNSAFKCHHAHCQGKGIEDLKIYLGLHEKWDEPLSLRAELVPVDPFRENMLPESIRGWIVDNADRMQAPVDFFAAACVVVLGALIGRKVGILPKTHDDEWKVIPNLWGAIVGRPSLLKSPAMAAMMKPLDNLADQAVKKHKTMMKQFEEEQMWSEAQKSTRKDEMKKMAKQIGARMPSYAPLDEVTEPALKRYKTDDATVQKIGEILSQNSQGILVHRDELVGWAKSLDAYGREGDRAFFLEGWNGNGPFTVDRIGRGTLHIPALCISVIGGIQPGPLEKYVHQASSGGGGDDGLLQRFQLLVWPDAPKKWTKVDRPPDPSARELAYDIFQKLDAFEPFEPSQDRGFETFTLRFDSDAQKKFDDWRDALEQELLSGTLSPALESHLGKYRSLMPSLALIFSLTETIGRGHKPTAVDVQSAELAIRWCHYLKTHAQRLYASGKNSGMESAKALLERIKKGELLDGFSPRSVYHARHWANLDTPEKVNDALKVLEDLGWVRSESLKTGGKPSTKIRIHPSLRTINHKTDLAQEGE